MLLSKAGNNPLYAHFEERMERLLLDTGKAEYGENVTVVPSETNIWTESPMDSWGPLKYTVTIMQDIDRSSTQIPFIDQVCKTVFLGVETAPAAPKSRSFENCNPVRFTVIFVEDPEISPSPYRIEWITTQKPQPVETSLLAANSPASYPMFSTPNLNTSTTFIADSPLPPLEILKNPDELKRDQEERLAQYEKEEVHLLDKSLTSSPAPQIKSPTVESTHTTTPPLAQPTSSVWRLFAKPFVWGWRVVCYVGGLLNSIRRGILG